MYIVIFISEALQLQCTDQVIFIVNKFHCQCKQQQIKLSIRNGSGKVWQPHKLKWRIKNFIPRNIHDLYYNYNIFLSSAIL